VVIVSPRRKQILLVVFFVVLVFGVPLSQSGLEIYQGGRPRLTGLITQAPTQANLRAFERTLEEASWLAGMLRPKMQSLMFHLFRDLGDKVVLGKDHWLFYKPDVQYLVEPLPMAGNRTPAEDDPLTTIIAFQKQLRARNIHLLVMPVPGKPSIYPEMLSTLLGPGKDAVVASNTLQLITQLKSAGVEVVDLFRFFHESKSANRSLREGDPYYLSQDTHWTGNAAEMAAHHVARRLLDLGWVEPGSGEYNLRSVSVRRRSDIIRMVRIGSIEAYFPGDAVNLQQVVEEATSRLYKDDSKSSVLILGDSFLRIYQTDEPRSAGFIAHLARALKQPLASIVNDGGASTLVRQELSRRAELLNDKRIVIWEFVERDIRFGMEGWKYVALPSRAQPFG